MKYSGQITIYKPQIEVATLFANPENNKEYQDGFLRKELISGTQGMDGAISKMYYQFGKREMELTETIIANRLPESFEAFYHHPHMDNTMKCKFIPLDENSCRYVYEFEYTRVSWLMPKLMFLLFPGMFRKQGEKWIRQFKEFAEKK
ncbi:MAG: SRPBCC family protein [Saprospiraceae bacterium]|nr:SRPBCC family protein [Saprospiraceae bacterium]